MLMFIVEIAEIAGLAHNVPATPRDNQSQSSATVPSSGSSTRSGRSAAAELMDQADTSHRENTAGRREVADLRICHDPATNFVSKIAECCHTADLRR